VVHQVGSLPEMFCISITLLCTNLITLHIENNGNSLIELKHSEGKENDFGSVLIPDKQEIRLYE
jgi:hypothetical protein